MAGLDLKLNIQPAKRDLEAELASLQSVASGKPIKVKLKVDKDEINKALSKLKKLRSEASKPIDLGFNFGKNNKNPETQAAKIMKTIAKLNKQWKSLDDKSKNLKTELGSRKVDDGYKKYAERELAAVKYRKAEIMQAVKGMQKLANQNVKLDDEGLRNVLSSMGELGAKSAKTGSELDLITSRVANNFKLLDTSVRKPTKNIEAQRQELQKYSTTAKELAKSIQSQMKSISDMEFKRGVPDSKKFDQSELIKMYKMAKARAKAFDEAGTKINKGEMSVDDLNFDNIEAGMERLKTSTHAAVNDSKLAAQEINTNFAKIDQAARNNTGFDKLGNRLNSHFSTFEKGIRKNQKLYNDYLTLNSKFMNQDFGSLNEATDAFARYRTDCRKAGVEVDSFGAKLEKTFGSRVRSALAGEGVFLMQSALQDIVKNAVDVDTAMTEVKKVTDETDSTYVKFLSDAGGRAQNIGASLKETINATADFARLGYNLNEATKLADSAIVYKNVGDDVNSIDDATGSLISTMQGFGIAANDSMKIVDKFNNVSNKYASSAGDIGEITRRSAASMRAAGNDLD